MAINCSPTPHPKPEAIRKAGPGRRYARLLGTSLLKGAAQATGAALISAALWWLRHT
jgi:hypothetical protein